MPAVREVRIVGRPFTPSKVSPPVGGYSHGCLVPEGRQLLFISGQIPETADGAVPNDFEAQCRAVWENIRQILAEAGMSFANLVKVTTFLTSKTRVEANSRIRQDLLQDCRPALTVMIAETLESQWLLEIEAVTAA